MRQIWEKFVCNNCGWTTYGSYMAPIVLPDTDCPKCGSHDSVTGDDGDHPKPADIDALIADQNIPGEQR